MGKSKATNVKANKGANKGRRAKKDDVSQISGQEGKVNDAPKPTTPAPTPVTPPAEDQMTPEQRADAIATLVAQLEASEDRKLDKRIRAKLRRLGHRGGLRSVKATVAS